MRTITATEASRRFSDLLDAIERGETVTITRGHTPIAEIGPARRRTGADLRAALHDIAPPDERSTEASLRPWTMWWMKGATRGPTSDPGHQRPHRL